MKIDLDWEQVHIGDIVYLRGLKEQHRKLIKRRGPRYEVINFLDSVPCLDGDAGVLLKCYTTRSMLWIRLYDDPNFALEGVD